MNKVAPPSCARTVRYRRGYNMDLITLDFETYYDEEYSLELLTTEQYIRSEQFQTIGVSVKVNSGEAIWISGPHEAIKTYLHNNYNWEHSALLAHNTQFDGAILGWLYDIHPKAYLDTLCIARALHGTEVGGSLKYLAQMYEIGEKGTEVVDAVGKHLEDFTEGELASYGDYCINDVELTYQLFNIFMKVFPKKELRVVDMTLRMFIEPVLELNAAKLYDHLDNLREQKEALLVECGVSKEDLMSAPKFAKVLQSLGVVPPTKISPRTGKEIHAFAKNDAGLKSLMEHEDPRIQAMVAARLGVKSTLEESRTARFLDIAMRGALPVPIRYCAAHTTRWGGSDAINLQNLPSRGPNGKVLKSTMCAPVGYSLIEADSAQIEARILAWWAGQSDLLAAFTRGEDVYRKMAATIYRMPQEEVSDAQRFIGKQTILGAGYGMGPTRFREQLKGMGVLLSMEEGARIIRIYRENHPQIVRLWRQAQNVLQGMVMRESYALGKPGVIRVLGKTNGMQLPSGLIIHYNDLKAVEGDRGLQFSYKTRRGRVNIYGGKVVENDCVDGDALVLTPRGWVALCNLQSSDMVHDGETWVHHGGVLNKSMQTCVEVDGVLMTPDHEVLTNEGWQAASQNPRPYRPNIRRTDLPSNRDESPQYRTNGGRRSLEQGDRDSAHNAVLQASTWVGRGGIGPQAQPCKQVYDILNAGPLNRFVVKGQDGPFIVHNCQGIARCIMSDQMLLISRRYPVLLTVHDSVVCCVPDAEITEAATYIYQCMAYTPEWAKGLPVRGDVGVGKNYGNMQEWSE